MKWLASLRKASSTLPLPAMAHTTHTCTHTHLPPPTRPIQGCLTATGFHAVIWHHQRDCVVWLGTVVQGTGNTLHTLFPAWTLHSPGDQTVFLLHATARPTWAAATLGVGAAISPHFPTTTPVFQQTCPCSATADDGQFYLLQPAQLAITHTFLWKTVVCVHCVAGYVAWNTWRCNM